MPLIKDFLDHINLQRQDDNNFIGYNKPSGTPQHIYGGQVLGQALSAASQTVENRFCHSISCQFLRKGDFDSPIRYTVERIRDGKSFSSRRITATQKTETILTLDASFQVEVEGFNFEPSMPVAPHPEDLIGLPNYKDDFYRLNRESLYDFLVKDNIFDFRHATKPSFISTENRQPCQQIWFRSKEMLPQKPDLHRTILAYISDLNFIRTASLPFLEEAGDNGFQLVSLNHSMWIHHTPDLNDWLLFDMKGTAAVGQKVLVTGHIFNLKGKLIATATQEGLFRLINPKKSQRALGPKT